MNRRLVKVVWAVLSALLALGCIRGAQAAEFDCAGAVRVTREAMALMATTARDESTQLRRLVQNGWQTAFDDLIVIRSFKVGACHPAQQSARVEVHFDVIGRLVAAGQGNRVALQVDQRVENIELLIVEVDGTMKIDDLSSMVPHVEPAYALQILTEIKNNEPQSAARCHRIIEELHGFEAVPKPSNSLTPTK